MSRNAINSLTGEVQTEIPTIVVVPVSCPECGSIERTKIEAVTSVDAEVEIDGQLFTRVSWGEPAAKLAAASIESKHTDSSEHDYS